LNHKGQSSLEFLAFVSISAIILAGMYGVMAQKQEDTYEFAQQRNAQKIAEKTSFQVEMGLIQGDGYSRVFSLPAEIGGSSYNLTIVNRSVLVEWRDQRTRRSSLYSGEELNITTKNDNVFKIVNNDENISLKQES
jgi:Na+-transporting NADH:ubiquinone oxidoreductase subunit NqrC